MKYTLNIFNQPTLRAKVIACPMSVELPQIEQSTAAIIAYGAMLNLEK